jgi:hypothetical protein
MTKPSSDLLTLGFYTVLEHPEIGWTAGYLLLTTSGRPIEFHCTLPVRPTRTQSLLFGASLGDYLIAERFPATLFDRSRTAPVLLCVDQTPALAVQRHLEIPVVRVLAEEPAVQGEPPVPASEESAVSPVQTTGWGHRESGTVASLTLGSNRILLAGAAGMTGMKVVSPQQDIESLWQSLECQLDLSEPFDRIREALREATREARLNVPRAQAA